jgi:alpha-methylacyl-CoA racemase
VSAVAGALRGIRVIEMAGLGPAPFAGMMLADMGADVVRIDRFARVAGSDRSGAVEAPGTDDDVLNRGKRSIAVDLKNPAGVELVLQLSESADILIEGFRPGVMERLGLGPDVVAVRNPQLVYGRMTGWGQDGPLAAGAGHDINYISWPRLSSGRRAAGAR